MMTRGEIVKVLEIVDTYIGRWSVLSTRTALIERIFSEMNDRETEGNERQ